MGRWLRWSMEPGTSPAASALVRGAAGVVFIVSGLLKFLYENHGPLRFAKIGLPSPAALAHFVGAVEVVGGALLLVGLAARAAALVLAFDMLVALAVTKLPLLWGPGPEPVSAPPKTSLLAFLYQARLDLTMLAVVVWIVLAGAGAASMDARRAR